MANFVALTSCVTVVMLCVMLAVMRAARERVREAEARWASTRRHNTAHHRATTINDNRSSINTNTNTILHLARF